MKIAKARKWGLGFYNERSGIALKISNLARQFKQNLLNTVAVGDLASYLSLITANVAEPPILANFVISPDGQMRNRNCAARKDRTYFFQS